MILRFFCGGCRIVRVMVVLYFVIIALMRGVQSNFNRRASRLIEGSATFLHYAGYYNLVSAAIGLIAVAVFGFGSYSTFTLVCAAAVGLLLVADLFANLEAVKRCTLSLVVLFSMGGLTVPCVAGIFLFDEPMSAWQWVGLAVFAVSAFFMISGSGETYGKLSFKTFLLLILTFSANGAVMLLQKLFAVKEENGNVWLFSLLSFAVGAGLLYAITLTAAVSKRKKIKPLGGKLYLYGAVLAAAVFSIASVVTLAAKVVPSIVLFPVSSALNIMISAAVGAICFKEKITVKNVIGLVLGLIAITVINLL